jgi:hypothetical protein
MSRPTAKEQTGFDFAPAYVPEWQRQRATEREVQAAHLERVTSKLSAAILLFCKQRIAACRPEFHMEDIRGFLTTEAVEFAPASPDRVLRQLRKLRAVDYVVVNRAESLYRITEVRAGKVEERSVPERRQA